MDTWSQKVTVRLFLNHCRNDWSKSYELQVINLQWRGFWPGLRYLSLESGWRRSLYPSFSEWIQWADHLIFVYPIWWVVYTEQASERLDRSGLYRGFAYSAPMIRKFYLGYLRGKQFERLLQGKQPVFIRLHVAPTWWYKITGSSAFRWTLVSLFWRMPSWTTVGSNQARLHLGRSRLGCEHR